MKITVTPRVDDTYIEKAWKHAETEEIEDLAAGLLGKAQEAESIEDDLFCVLYLAFRCGFKTAIGNLCGGRGPLSGSIRLQMREWKDSERKSAVVASLMLMHRIEAKPSSAPDICATRPRSVQ